jgi:hypothetical protein
MNLKDPMEAIDFLVAFTGKLSRKELVSLADITNATATRWISGFIDKYPDWLSFENKIYKPTGLYRFNELFSHNPEAGLNFLAYGVIQRSVAEVKTYSGSIPDIRDNAQLNTEVVATICRSICSTEVLTIIYNSTTSGETRRNIKPHSIFYAGGQWYLRSLSISNGISDFRTFKFSRMISAKSFDSTNTIDSRLVISDDIEWNTFEVLSICPHPEHKERGPLLNDMGISGNSVRNYKIRKTLVPHFLIDNHIDFTKGHTQNPNSHPYWLANLEDLSDLAFLTNSKNK